MKLALWTKKIILVGEEESCGEEKTLVENRSKMLREKSMTGEGTNPS